MLISIMPSGGRKRPPADRRCPPPIPPPYPVVLALSDRVVVKQEPPDGLGIYTAMQQVTPGGVSGVTLPCGVRGAGLVAGGVGNSVNVLTDVAAMQSAYNTHNAPVPTMLVSNTQTRL